MSEPAETVFVFVLVFYKKQKNWGPTKFCLKDVGWRKVWILWGSIEAPYWIICCVVMRLCWVFDNNSTPTVCWNIVNNKSLNAFWLNFTFLCWINSNKNFTCFEFWCFFKSSQHFFCAAHIEIDGRNHVHNGQISYWRLFFYTIILHTRHCPEKDNDQIYTKYIFHGHKHLFKFSQIFPILDKLFRFFYL